MKKTSFKTYLRESVLPEAHELREIVKFYPKRHKEVIKHFWGTDKLSFKGQLFFTNEAKDTLKGGPTGMGPVYEGLEKAATAYMKSNKVDISHSWDISVALTEGQECYVGYDKHTDQLVVGYDLWIDDDEVDEQLEQIWMKEEFEQPAAADKKSKTKVQQPTLTEEDYEEMNEFISQERKKISNTWGGLYFVKSNDGKNFTVVNAMVKPGLFYKSIYGKYTNELIDLRLD